MSGGGEARHIDADLSQDHLGGELTHPGHRGQQAGALLDPSATPSRRMTFYIAVIRVRNSGRSPRRIASQDLPVHSRPRTA